MRTNHWLWDIWAKFEFTIIKLNYNTFYDFREKILNETIFQLYLPIWSIVDAELSLDGCPNWLARLLLTFDVPDPDGGPGKAGKSSFDIVNLLVSMAGCLTITTNKKQSFKWIKKEILVYPLTIIWSRWQRHVVRSGCFSATKRRELWRVKSVDGFNPVKDGKIKYYWNEKDFMKKGLTFCSFHDWIKACPWQNCLIETGSSPR